VGYHGARYWRTRFGTLLHHVVLFFVPSATSRCLRLFALAGGLSKRKPRGSHVRLSVHCDRVCNQTLLPTDVASSSSPRFPGTYHPANWGMGVWKSVRRACCWCCPPPDDSVATSERRSSGAYSISDTTTAPATQPPVSSEAKVRPTPEYVELELTEPSAAGFRSESWTVYSECLTATKQPSPSRRGTYGRPTQPFGCRRNSSGYWTVLACSHRFSFLIALECPSSSSSPIAPITPQ
jgi:hypothetical protein